MAKKFRPPPVSVAKSPTHEVIAWKPVREATPLITASGPPSSTGSLTIKKVPVWK